MTSTAEVIQTLRAERAPPFLLDLVRWAGPRLEGLDEPEAFYVAFQLALAELAEGRTEDGRPLSGSLVRRPPRLYATLALLAPKVAGAYRGSSFQVAVYKAAQAIEP